MKFTGRKKRSTAPEPTAPVEPEPEKSFYHRDSGEETLYEAAGSGGQGAHRASRGTPARRRENNNRASDRQLIVLLLKIALIPIVLFGAYLGLKAIVNRLSDPSEEQVQKWEQDAENMQPRIEGGSGSADSILLDKAFLEQQAARWEQAERHLRSAATLERRGIDDEAAARLKEALNLMPNNRQALRLLLDIYIRSGNFTEALPLCVRLLDQDSGGRDVKMLLLKALQETEQMEAGLFLAEQMLEQEPNRLDILETAAYAHASLGAVDKALNIYKRILERDKDHQLALKGAGYIYQWQKAWEQAIPYYMELVRLSPNAEHYRVLARCYAQQEEPGKVAIFLGQAASLYGGKTVGPWLRDPDFDPVRESVDFRSLSDRIVGVAQRKAIEDIRRRKVTPDAPVGGASFELPTRPQLDILRPGR